MTYICSICGNEHNEIPRDMAFHRPDAYFLVPPDKREKRVWFDSERNPDLCVIDGSQFYIRGVLSVPIQNEGDEFLWGAWLKVDEKDFRRYCQLWDEADVANEPAFRGYLSSNIRDFADSNELEVTVELQSNNQRPRLEVISKMHPLAIAQRNGVTLEDVHRFALPMTSQQ